MKFNSDDKLPINKTMEISTKAMIVRAIFLKIKNIIHKFF